jgi:tetratricopeptide (TPR) repeat protein
MARAQGALDYGPAARESVGRALALEPQNVDAVGLSVMFDVADGRREAALARVLELRRRLPQDSAAALLEGDLRSTLGQHAEAAAAFAQSARLKPSLAATVRLAQSRQLAGQRDAIAPLRDWLKTRPGDLPARAMMAILLDQSGQVEPAMREYERVLASGEPDAVMSNNLAVLYQKMGDGRAEALARQAYRLAPTNAAIADTLGWILHSKGAREEGIRLLREAAGLAPQEPEIQLHLAEALLDAGQAGEARAILARLVDGGSEFAGRPRAQELLRRAGG